MRRRHHLVRKNGGGYDPQEYEEHPERYISVFAQKVSLYLDRSLPSYLSDGGLFSLHFALFLTSLSVPTSRMSLDSTLFNLVLNLSLAIRLERERERDLTAR